MQAWECADALRAAAWVRSRNVFLATDTEDAKADARRFFGASLITRYGAKRTCVSAMRLGLIGIRPKRNGTSTGVRPDP